MNALVAVVPGGAPACGTLVPVQVAGSPAALAERGRPVLRPRPATPAAADALSTAVSSW